MKIKHVILLIGIMLTIISFSSNANSRGTNTDIKNVDIVIAADATKQEIKAASELSAYLREVYPGYLFSVKNKTNENNITIRMGLPGSILPDEALSSKIPLEKEGFLIRRLNEKNVVILSRSVKGLFNAVYSLLEKLGYGFYLSYEGKPLPKKALSFNDWELTDYPLQSERIVFNWHNFVSGCTGWNYEDWCSWIDQSAKMRYNTIMVHAYGNNPMFSFEYNGLKKDIGYLTTSQSGRDWGAQHVNDVRRLPGGKVFTSPVFGSTAALVPDDQRGDAATKLMAKVFEHAKEMAMKINFAVDVDTWPANPRNIIESLPAECRIKLKEQDIVNPGTEAGYQYYKAQIKKLLTDYPQISTITPWVRSETSNGSIWNRVKPTDFPKSWLREWEQALIKHPELGKDKFGARTYAISKVVIAFQKALKEIKREDVTIAFGTWGWEFLPAASILIPENCPLILLDEMVKFDSEETKKSRSELGSSRKVIPIFYGQHDDHRYMGKPYTPFTKFNDLLTERNTAGFGILHWTTRPLDLLFKSLSDQVWSTSANKSLASTISDYSRTIFGQQQDALIEYLTEWIEHGPMFGRETQNHFFDLGKQIFGEKYEPTEVTLDRIQKRIAILKKVDPSKLTDLGKKMFNYDSAMEQFYMSLFQNQDKFYKVYALLERQSLDSARAILQTVSPEKSIELYSEASVKLPITAGEKALIISMGTRWLPDFVNLKQRARMVDICYKFEATQHDSLAQQPGIFSYFIDKEKTIWSCLGEKELKAGGSGSFDKKEAAALPEISQTFMKMSAPFMLPLVTIGKNPLVPGRYVLEIKYNLPADGSDCRMFLVSKTNRMQLQSKSRESGSKLRTISTIIDIKDSQKYSIEVDPGKSGKRFTNCVIKPLK